MLAIKIHVGGQKSALTFESRASSTKGTWTQNARLNNPESEGNAALERLKADWRKVELDVRIIRYFRVGYILILLTPVLSFAVLSLLVGVIESLGGGGRDAHCVERFDIGTLDNWDSPVYLWVREARVDRCRSKSDFAVQLLSHSVGSVYLPFCFRVVRATVFRSMNPEMSALTTWDYMEFWTWELKAILWIRHRAPVNSNFTREDVRYALLSRKG